MSFIKVICSGCYIQCSFFKNGHHKTFLWYHMEPKKEWILFEQIPVSQWNDRPAAVRSWSCAVKAVPWEILRSVTAESDRLLGGKLSQGHPPGIWHGRSVTHIPLPKLPDYSWPCLHVWTSPFCALGSVVSVDTPWQRRLPHVWGGGGGDQGVEN